MEKICGACGENLPYGEILLLDRFSCVEIFHLTNCQWEKCTHMVNIETNLSCGYISPYEEYGDKFVAKYALLTFMLFCCEIQLVTIYVGLHGKKLNQRLCLKRDMTNIRKRPQVYLGPIKTIEAIQIVCHGTVALG